jgi:hypothetical protein
LDPASSQYVTRYGQTSQERRENNYVIGQGGLLRNANGELLGARDSGASFVYDADRTIRQFRPAVQLIYRNGQRQAPQRVSDIPDALSIGARAEATHHTTAVRGHPVGAGGSQTAVGGVPKDIRDNSGHYQPEAEYTYQYVRDLRAAGNPLRYRTGDGAARTTVTLIGAEGTNAAERKAWVGENPAYYQKDLTLTADQFLATRGNERQARLKKNMLDQLSRGNRY